MARSALLAFVLLLWIAPSSARSEVVAGDAAPPITLEALTNVPDDAPAHEALSWDTFAGKTVVLEFWGTWCGPCVAAIPHLNELAEATADEDVAFLSVTFEDTGIIEDFLEKLPMESWVGHDTDRTMVDAFGVRGWPTTFIVRDGVVLERTHPTGLTLESLRGFASGDPASAIAAAREKKAEVESTATVKAEPETEPILHIRIAPTPDGATPGGVSTGGVGHIRGNMISRESLAKMIWGNYRHHDIEIKNPDAEFEVEVRATQAPEEAVRATLAAALGLEMTVETRTLDGYIATAPDGVTLEEGILDRPLGYSMRGSSEEMTLTSSSTGLGTVLQTVERQLKAPIDDETGIGEDRYFFLNELRLPRDASALIQELEAQTGIVLTPARLEREVAVIRSAADEDVAGE